MPKRTTEKMSVRLHRHGSNKIKTTIAFDEAGDAGPIEQWLADIAAEQDIIIVREPDESLADMRDRVVEGLKDKINDLSALIDDIADTEIDGTAEENSA